MQKTTHLERRVHLRLSRVCRLGGAPCGDARITRKAERLRRRRTVGMWCVHSGACAAVGPVAAVEQHLGAGGEAARRRKTVS